MCYPRDIYVIPETYMYTILYVSGYTGLQMIFDPENVMSYN